MTDSTRVNVEAFVDPSPASRSWKARAATALPLAHT